jgi:hypothetical protein
LWWLSYFHKLLLPHNIDVMHNEKNVVESIFSTFLKRQWTMQRQGLINRHFATDQPSTCTMM